MMQPNEKITQQKPTLVVGGTGKTGARVVDRLVSRGLPIRSVAPSSEPPFDWTDETTWAPALRGIGSAYVTYFPDLAAPGAPAAIRSFTDLALASGVRRLVLLAGRGEAEAEECEQIVRDSGADWTIVRSTWFCQNFSESYLLEPIRRGHVLLPAGDVGEPFVDAGDIADVAVAALTDDRHVGQTYELTGPRLLTFAEAVAEIADAVGREIRYTQVSAEEFAAALREQNVPDAFVDLLLYLFTTVLDGRNARLTDGVRRALGREPRDFADYARESAATGVWDATG
jgi:uncharacterized protein YbjT (DUF2867 family)